MPAPVEAKQPRLTDEQRAMVEANLGLVAWTIRHYFGGMSAEWQAEAKQDGVLGLATAVRKYDAGRGHRFATMATPWIRASIQKGMGRREGSAFRRWQHGDADKPDTPLSLDYTVDDDDGFAPTFADVLPDRGPAPDDMALAGPACADIAATLAGCCADSTDRRIVELLLVREGRTDAAMVRTAAEVTGVDPATVRRRLQRLRAEAADRLVAA